MDKPFGIAWYKLSFSTILVMHDHYHGVPMCWPFIREPPVPHQQASQSVQEAIDAVQHSTDARDFLLSVKEVHNIKQNHNDIHFNQHQNDAVSLSVMV
jgi:hypothetical protein